MPERRAAGKVTAAVPRTISRRLDWRDIGRPESRLSVRVNRRLFSLRSEQMFGTIAGVLKDESETFSNQLSELAAHIQASLAELAKMAARFDIEGDWGAGGYRSCADFLSVRAGLNLRTGSELLRVGHAMERLPKLAEVFSAGEISFDKARAVASVATPADEHMWVELARQASTGPFSRWVLEYRRAAEADSPDRADAHAARRGVWSRWEDDGMLRLVAKLPPEEGAVVLAAIEALASPAAGCPPGAPKAPTSGIGPWAVPPTSPTCSPSVGSIIAGTTTATSECSGREPRHASRLPTANS